MKVTFCAHDRPDYVGGPNTWLRRLLPELRRRGIQVRVLFITTAQGDYPTVNALRQEGFDCPQIHWPHYTEQRVRWILACVAEDRPDVLVSNLNLAAFYAGRWAREAGIPTVGVLHSDDPFVHGLREEFVSGHAAWHVSGVVCVSRLLEKEVLLNAHEGVFVRRLPYGAPLPLRTASPPTEWLRMVYTGRFVEPQKRISEVARAMCRTARELDGVEGVLYGDGPARPEVEQILRGGGTEPPVRWAGRVDSAKIQDCLLEAHVFVLLSDYEGLPISLLEAMACGVVPVCLDTRSGVTELVEHNVTGLIVRNRKEDFISAVRRLREEAGLWERLSRAARSRIEAEYSSEVCADGWERFLKELAQRAGARQPIKIPRRLRLPPMNPSLQREDLREPVGLARVVWKGRLLAGRIKRRLAG